MHQKKQIDQKDNELADFTDRVLQGSEDRAASSLDEELLSLEKTVLRLTNTFPPASLDEAKSRHMLARLKTRIQREEEAQAAKPSFWKRLFDVQSNQQIGMLVAVAVVAMVIMVSVPVIKEPVGAPISGTASSGNALFAVLGLAGVLFVIYWISRRK